MSRKNILVLPGDGIGPEVCAAAIPVLDIFNLPLRLSYGDIGWHYWCTEGSPVPERTWQQIKKSDVILLGATTSHGKREAEKALPEALKNGAESYVSPIVQLRQKLGLYTNIRPCKYITGERKPFDLCVIRENSEGLYAGIDVKGIPESARDWIKHPNIDVYGQKEASCAVRLQTRFGLERLFNKAFNYAKNKGLDKVTLADKPNVLRESGQFSKDIFFSIADNYPSIKAEVHNVDALALWLTKRPETFGVIVAENMFGDILSDLAAGVMGGLGLASSANIGDSTAYFEPVHGSFPRMAGKNRVNPSAMFLTIALMLDHLGYEEEAKRIEHGVRQVVRQREKTTYDLGGNSSTQVMARAIMTAVKYPRASKSAAVITIGDELLEGQWDNTNQTAISKLLTEHHYNVKKQSVCADSLSHIAGEIIRACGDVDMLVISGGLGPTSDDVTRAAIAKALGVDLCFSRQSWEAIKARLQSFKLTVYESNKNQACFPEGANTIYNSIGTAPGFNIQAFNTEIVVLPGPSQEMQPMLESFISSHVENLPSTPIKEYKWSLLGAIESDISAEIDEIIKDSSLSASYLWKNPYVFVSVKMSSNESSDSEKITHINDLLTPFCVSSEGETACHLLKLSSPANWESSDIEALHSCCEFLEGLQKTTDKALSNTVKIETSPPLSTVLNNGIFTGSISISCDVAQGNRTDTFSIGTPLRGSEVIEFIREFSAHSYLKFIAGSKDV